MNSATITVHWHDDSQPVYSVDFQSVQDGIKKSERLSTAGGDNNIRIWKVNYKEDGTGVASLEHLSTLRKHTQAVNVTRFDPRGHMLASGGDDGALIIWTLSDHIVKDFGAEEDEEIKESWIAKQVLRSSTSEIYDLAWSPDSKYIATGSMDNITRIYSVESGQQIFQSSDHNHYVQGVAWDPRNQFLATQSADRTVHIYSIEHENQSVVPSLHFKISKCELPTSKLSTHNTGNVKEFKQNLGADAAISKRTTFLYHSETLQSFFRRLTFSPDGALLLTPLGIYRSVNETEEMGRTLEESAKQGENSEQEASKDDNEESSSDKVTNTVYIYIRSGLGKPPVCHLPGLLKPAIAVRFSPIIYKLSNTEKRVFDLPYDMIFAVATQDSVIIYSTSNLEPLGFVSNLHYSVITDLVWDRDGQSIIISSADGFCSAIVFEGDAFGDILFNTNDVGNFWENVSSGEKREPRSELNTSESIEIAESHMSKHDVKEKANAKGTTNSITELIGRKNVALKNSPKKGADIEMQSNAHDVSPKSVDDNRKQKNDFEPLKSNTSKPNLVNNFVTEPFSSIESAAPDKDTADVKPDSSREIMLPALGAHFETSKHTGGPASLDSPDTSISSESGVVEVRSDATTGGYIPDAKSKSTLQLKKRRIVPTLVTE
ncbi:uncharacterized protein PRCAT00002935001 [Priceomyces carsonii]|uniref:uncharacterized protein n=1 Tax=Priceomyces carsonii TaxID=28549 RepID=UPI002EDAE6FB|nr:unnamed protein product [Priceomyces carsonii]